MSDCAKHSHSHPENYVHMSLFNKCCIEETLSNEMGDWMGSYVDYWETFYLLTLKLMMLTNLIVCEY